MPDALTMNSAEDSTIADAVPAEMAVAFAAFVFRA